MKLGKFSFGAFILVLLLASVLFSQQQFIQTVTRENKSCNATCSVLDVPELNGNPAAIIFVTREDPRELDPHPIGAYFMYLKKWSIYNVDGAAMPEGARFNVEYYASSGPERFVYIATNKGNSCIDHRGLNANPSAQIRSFPTSSPSRGAFFNRDDIRILYDASILEWCITNLNGSRLPAETAYNISFSQSSTNTGAAQGSSLQAPASRTNPPADSPTPTPINTAGLQTTMLLPSATLAPSPLAPLVVVARVQWPLPDQGNISLSPGYCRPISGSYSNTDILATDTAIVTGSTENQGYVLTWTATIASGSVQLNVCNSQKASLGASGALQLSGRRVNVLVVR